jgi:hypothetical protein
MSDLRFDLGETLTAYLDDPLSILTPEADAGLLDCENDAEAFTPGAINGALDGIIDAIAENPEAVLQPSHLQTLEFLLKYVFTGDMKIRFYERKGLSVLSSNMSCRVGNHRSYHQTLWRRFSICSSVDSAQKQSLFIMKSKMVRSKSHNTNMSFRRSHSFCSGV